MELLARVPARHLARWAAAFDRIVGESGLGDGGAFERTRRACEKLGITLLVIDSWGPFMDGDMESARDVIRFYNTITATSSRWSISV